MAGEVQILINRRKAERATNLRAANHAGQSQLSASSLLRHCAPRNDMYGRGICDPGPDGPERRDNYAKQSQFPEDRICANLCLRKGLRENGAEFASEKTKPIILEGL
jgi:hypothetical protein